MRTPQEDNLEAATIGAVWQRIEAAFEAAGIADDLNPGATPEAINQTESALGLSLPDELKESLLRHNGSVEGSWPKGELLSLERIEGEARVWRELLADGTFNDASDFDGSQGSNKLKNGWWNNGWIPLDADGGGNGAFVDADPGPSGTLGQVADMDHEVGPNGPLFDSLSEYLADIAATLESGTTKWDGGSWESEL